MDNFCFRYAGGVCHESCAGVVAIGNYLKFLASNGMTEDNAAPIAESPTLDRQTVEEAFRVMQALEDPLTDMLVDGLANIPEVQTLSVRFMISCSLRVTTLWLLRCRSKCSRV